MTEGRTEFTQDYIHNRLKLPAGFDDYAKFDSKTPGFGIRIRRGKHGETRTYFLQYKLNGTHRRITLGSARDLSCKAARALAEAERGKVSTARLGHGIDPALQRQQQRDQAKPKPKAKSIGALLDDYLAEQKDALAPRSYENKEYHLKKQWAPLHLMSPGDVTRNVVSTQYNAIAKPRKNDKGREIGGTVTANRARASLSAFFAWLIEMGICDHNPVEGSRKVEEAPPRDRILNDAEVATIWSACGENDHADASLRWSEVDLEAKTITLPAARTKNGYQHVIPLSGAALSILKNKIRIEDRDLVFGEGEGGYSGWSRSKATLDKACNVKGWRLHDLRRTAATRMADIGVQPHVIEAVLNHVSGHKAGVAGVYNRATYEPEKAAAVKALANHWAIAVAQANGENVTPLRKAYAKRKSNKSSPDPA